MTYEDGSDIRMKNKRVAKIRYFYGVNKHSSEAIAYIDEEKIIAVIVISSKTQRGLDGAMPRFRGMFETYSYMDAKFAPGAAPKRSD
jgi:hypothetical protein